MYAIFVYSYACEYISKKDKDKPSGVIFLSLNFKRPTSSSLTFNGCLLDYYCNFFVFVCRGDLAPDDRRDIDSALNTL